MTRIKICGLSRPQDVEAVNLLRPHYAGFVVNFPRSRRSVPPETARALREQLREDIVPVGVFVDQSVELVAQLQNDGAVTVAQLHGGEDAEYIARLRDLTGGKPVWKAFRVRTPSDLDAARASSAGLVLLDNGCGTGAAFDWSLAGDVGRPWLLAGGLDAGNVRQAIAALCPWGVDVSSGVETDGRKDPDKMRAFVDAVREEDTRL